MGAALTAMAWLLVCSTPDGGSPEPQLVPPALERDSTAQYPEALLQQRMGGEVRLRLVIDEHGQVSEAEVLQSVHPLLDMAALRACLGLRFTPAQLDGEAVPVQLEFSYHFEPPPPAVPRAILEGMVRSKGNRRPIVGALIQVGDTPPIETDAHGRFQVELPQGVHQVQVSAPGFKPRLFDEQLGEERRTVLYALKPRRVDPYETVVYADEDRTEQGSVRLREQELREVPGTMGDPFRVVMLLPGVSGMMSGVAYPVVRGASPAATGYFLDGVRVPQLFHLFLGPAVVHPEFIDGIDFHGGGAPVRYGRLMGGVVEGNVSRPREDSFHASAFADLIHTGAFVEFPVEKTGTQVTLAGRLSYTPWILSVAEQVLSPDGERQRWVLDFGDYQGRVEQKVGDGRLRLLAFGSSDRFGFDSDELGAASVMQEVHFHRADLRFRSPLGPSNLEAAATYGFDRFELNQRAPDRQAGVAVDQDGVQLRSGWGMSVGQRAQVSLGTDVDHRRARVSLSGSAGESVVGIEQRTEPEAIATFVGGFGEFALSLPEPLTWIAGVRVDNYHLVPGVNHLAVDPRLSLHFQPTPMLTFKGAAGMFHQPPTFLIHLPVVDLAGLQLGLQQGVQLSAGVEWAPVRALDLSAELYFNPLLRTVELTPFNDDGGVQSRVELGPALAARVDELSSHGMAYGLELMVRHPLGDNWFGWLSYSWQHSTRYQRFLDFDGFGRPTNFRQGYVPFAFDQTHVFNAVLSYKLPGSVTVGTALHFNTGRPEAGGVTSQTHREGVGLDGKARWVRVSRDAADRLPSFWRVDARVSKSWAFNTFTLDAYLDFLNVSLSQEVLAFTYQQEPGPLQKRAEAIPLALPILGVKGAY